MFSRKPLTITLKTHSVYPDIFPLKNGQYRARLYGREGDIKLERECHSSKAAVSWTREKSRGFTL